MNISNISSAASSVSLSVEITRKAQIQMVKDGQAAISLIQANEAVTGSEVTAAPTQPAQPSASSDHIVDVTA